jgi:hypothetical protein
MVELALIVLVGSVRSAILMTILLRVEAHRIAGSMPMLRVLVLSIVIATLATPITEHAAHGIGQTVAVRLPGLLV